MPPSDVRRGAAVCGAHKPREGVDSGHCETAIARTHARGKAARARYRKSIRAPPMSMLVRIASSTDSIVIVDVQPESEGRTCAPSDARAQTCGE